MFFEKKMPQNFSYIVIQPTTEVNIYIVSVVLFSNNNILMSP